jgi:hypothetical protein
MGSHFGTTLSFSQLDGFFPEFFTSYVSPVLSLPDFDPSLTTYIRDGMALVQCMNAKKHRNFGDLVTDYCRQLTSWDRPYRM